MSITFQIDTTSLEKSLDDLVGQMPYILMKSINDTVVGAQSAVIGHANDVFTIRRQSFLKMSMKVSKFATKDDLRATFQVADLGGKKTSDVFAKFETGGSKRPHNGGKLAVPTEHIRTNSSRVITASKRPRNLKNSWKGKTKNGREVIFQRKGKGKRETVNVAYVLKPNVHIDSRLKFVSTGMDSIRQNFTVNTDRWTAKAIASARL